MNKNIINKFNLLKNSGFIANLLELAKQDDKNGVLSVSIAIHSAGGKLAGMRSISSANILNKTCLTLALSDNEKIICNSCFSFRDVFRYVSDDMESNNKNAKNISMIKNQVRNTYLLTNRLLTKTEIIRLNINDLYFRFESFGDLNNETQLINYINIAKFYKNTLFALWSKHIDIIYHYIRNGGKLPKNLNIIISESYINGNNNLIDLAIEKLRALLTYKDNLKKFVVYEPKYIKENNIVINCGGKKCITCLNCYKKNKIRVINEKLK